MGAKRKGFIQRSIVTGSCFVMAEGQDLIGYGVLNYTFYGNGFIEMLYVDPNRRRQGAGIRLFRHLESLCQTSKLFTSTNQSNIPMQSLLTRAGYVPSGIIYNLDEDDPEIIYFKRLR